MVEWCKKFWQGRESTKDLARLGPARVNASDKNVRQVETALPVNRHIKVDKYQTSKNFLKYWVMEMVHSIIRSFGYYKVAAQWIPWPVSYTHLDVYKRQVQSVQGH